MSNGSSLSKTKVVSVYQLPGTGLACNATLHFGEKLVLRLLHAHSAFEKMTTNALQFHVRSASSSTTDCKFIIAAWDSVLLFLASVGAGAMWGTQPFSQRESFEEDIMNVIRKGEERPRSDSRRLLIAEILTIEKGVVRVGAAMIRDALPGYLVERPELKDEIDQARSHLFIEVLISDFRTRSRHKGAGGALIEAIKQRAILAGKDTVYVDAWAGNERKLNR